MAKRILVVDDEAPNRENLQELLKQYCPDVTVVAEAESVAAGVSLIRRHAPELVLLDIRMQDGTGFDLLQQLGQVNFEVIFITAYDQYGIQAIKYAALDYLLKPVERTRLEESLGVQLLQRTTRALQLTEAGRLYFEQASRALSELEQAHEALSQLEARPQGPVRITAPPDLGAQVLATLAARFVRRTPGITLEFILTGRLVNLVEEGVDLAVRAGPMRDSSLISRRVNGLDAWLFASRSYNAELKVEHDKTLPTNSFNCMSLYGLSLKNTAVQNNQEPKKSLPVK